MKKGCFKADAVCCAESSSPPIFDVESETHYNKHRRRMNSDTPRNKHYYNNNNTHVFESMQLWRHGASSMMLWCTQSAFNRAERERERCGKSAFRKHETRRISHPHTRYPLRSQSFTHSTLSAQTSARLVTVHFKSYFSLKVSLCIHYTWSICILVYKCF